MEGAPHTAKRTIDVPLGCPLPVYKGGGEGSVPRGARHGASPTRMPSASRIPPSFFWRGEKGICGDVEGKRGAAPPPLAAASSSH